MAQAQNLKLVVLAVMLAIGFVAKTEADGQRWVQSHRAIPSDVVSVIDAAEPVEVKALAGASKV